MGFILADANVLFSASLFVLVLIFMLELFGLLVGSGILGLLDSFFEIDLDGSSFTAQSLSFFGVRQIPFSYLLILFLLGFGLSGYFVNGIMIGLLNFVLPKWISCIPALIISFLFVSASSRVLHRVLPRDESSAVERASFVGKIAKITIGMARPGSPAQAKLKDEHGQTHYIMIEPEADETWQSGDVVIVLRSHGAGFVGFKESYFSEYLDS